jgi:hypothetical protein
MWSEGTLFFLRSGRKELVYIVDNLKIFGIQKETKTIK